MWVKDPIMERPEWWRMLDWDKMEYTWDKLSKEIKDKIRAAGLAPKFDEL